MSILNRDKILEAARQFIEQGKLDRAIKEYEKLLTADPKDMRVKLRVAELFSKRKQLNDAIRMYREVAESYTHDGFFLKAVTVYKNILRLNPSLLEVNQALGELYEKMGLVSDAVHHYEILAAALEQRGQFPESLDVRKKMVHLSPEDVEHRIRYAEGLQREGLQAEAIEQYQQLARQYEKAGGHEEERIDLYEKILPHHAGNVEMLRSLVNLYYQRHDIKGALGWLEKSKRVVLDQEDLLCLQAQIYAQLNQLETARSHYQQLAELYLKTGKVDEALGAYSEIIVLLPEEAANLKSVVESIRADSFDGLVEEAGRKRRKRGEESAARAEAAEKAREAPPPKPAKAETPKATKVTGVPAVTKVPEVPKVIDKPSVVAGPDTIKKIRSALGLARAYHKTGLETEAEQEFAHAKEWLEVLLKKDPDSAEGKELQKELGIFEKPAEKIAEKSEPKPKSNKKISFV